MGLRCAGVVPGCGRDCSSYATHYRNTNNTKIIILFFCLNIFVYFKVEAYKEAFDHFDWTKSGTIPHGVRNFTVWIRNRLIYAG